MANHVNPSSPLFLHHSDAPGVSLVAQPLTEDNYPSWSRAMMFALSSKNKLGFVDGTITKPDSNSTDYQPWMRCNTMVLSWIWNSVSKELTNSVIYMNSAKEVWDDLKERYAPSNSIQIYHIQQGISTLFQGELSVNAYYTALKGFWDELGSLLPIPPCTCGSAQRFACNQQLEKIIKFLMGLNNSYSTIRSQILTMDPVPSIGKVYSLVLQEEKQCAIRTPATPTFDAAALAALAHGRGRGRSVNKGKNQERPRCDFCGMLGHVQEKCYKLHGYPDKEKSREQNPAAANLTTALSGRANNCIAAEPNYGLTAGQYKQLMTLLNANTAEPSANFAGMIRSSIPPPPPPILLHG